MDALPISASRGALASLPAPACTTVSSRQDARTLPVHLGRLRAAEAAEEEAIEQEQAARSAEVREEQRARESAKEEGCERERVLAKGRVAARDCLQARVLLCLRGSGVLCASASARVRVRARISWSSP